MMRSDGGIVKFIDFQVLVNAEVEAGILTGEKSFVESFVHGLGNRLVLKEIPYDQPPLPHVGCCVDLFLDLLQDFPVDLVQGLLDGGDCLSVKLERFTAGGGHDFANLEEDVQRHLEDAFLSVRKAADIDLSYGVSYRSHDGTDAAALLGDDGSTETPPTGLRPDGVLGCMDVQGLVEVGHGVEEFQGDPGLVLQLPPLTFLGGEGALNT